MKTRPIARWCRRSGGAAATIVAMLALGSSPAHADAARPGNVWSTVTTVEPAGSPVTASIVGGDAFVRVRVAIGHEAMVGDYNTPPQPYLRFLANGTVQENVHSRAHFQNASRYAGNSGPAELGAPSWVTVGDDGTFAWHDHRVHFMARSVPDVTPWQIDLTVDGKPATIRGSYGPAQSPSAVPWLVLAFGLGAWAGVVTLLSARAGAVLVAAAALAALPIAVSLGRLPAAGGLVRTGGLVVAALALAGAAVVTRAKPIASALAAGGGIALALWAVLRRAVLGHAVLVSSMPQWWDRAAVAAALGIGVAVATMSIRSVVSPAAGAPVRSVGPPPAAPPAGTAAA